MTHQPFVVLSDFKNPCEGLTHLNLVVKRLPLSSFAYQCLVTIRGAASVCQRVILLGQLVFKKARDEARTTTGRNGSLKSMSYRIGYG